MGYRALVQTEDHLLLFLQQLGERTSVSPFLLGLPRFLVRLYLGVCGLALRKIPVECSLNSL